MSSATPSQSAELQRARDAYMQFFSDTFTDELVELYEQNGSTDAVQQLTACIETGVAIWGHPVVVPHPLEP